MNIDKKNKNNFVNLTNDYMELKARKITEIIFIFEIPHRGNTKFRRKKILKLPPSISKTKWVDFLSESLSDRYRTYYS